MGSLYHSDRHLTARSTTLKTINMKFMIIVMPAVGAMAVSELKEPELGNYLVVGTVESNPAAFMRYGYGPAPSPVPTPTSSPNPRLTLVPTPILDPTMITLHTTRLPLVTNTTLPPVILTNSPTRRTTHTHLMNINVLPLKGHQPMRLPLTLPSPNSTPSLPLPPRNNRRS